MLLDRLFNHVMCRALVKRSSCSNQRTQCSKTVDRLDIFRTFVQSMPMNYQTVIISIVAFALTGRKRTNRMLPYHRYENVSLCTA